MPKTITFNNKELGELVQAVQLAADIANDAVLEDLYGQRVNTVGIAPNELEQIRTMISLRVEQLTILNQLLHKLGVDTIIS